MPEGDKAMKKYIIPIQFIVIFLAFVLSGYAEQPKERITNSLGMEFVLIKPGKFMMGSPENELGRSKGEIPHEINLTNPFYMQITEVTQGQWKALMKRNPSSQKRCGDNCPVTHVTWMEAQKFIQELNQKEGTDKYRLPTEAEWEYACRAGTTTALPNGDITELECGKDPNLYLIGWYCGNSGDNIQAVAQKKPNAWGLHDMPGNVQEWCQDYFGVYTYDEVTNPKGPPKGSYRAMRSGAFYSPARDLRCASRFGSTPHYIFRHIGFRLCRTP